MLFGVHKDTDPIPRSPSEPVQGIPKKPQLLTPRHRVEFLNFAAADSTFVTGGEAALFAGR